MNTTVAPNYIVSLLKPNGKKASGRKVWSIDLESVWLPFFTATNTEGLTAIPNEALGAPLRLAYQADGTVRFNERTGRPVIRVAKELGDNVKLVRENFVAGLQNYVKGVRANNGESYKEQVRLNIEAGTPIVDNDREALDKALAEAMAEAMANKSPTPEATPEAVTA